MTQPWGMVTTVAIDHVCTCRGHPVDIHVSRTA